MKNRIFKMTGRLIAVVVAVAIVWWIYRALPRLRIDDVTERGIMPTQIQSVRDIGQWEFLSVNDEELVDTTRQGIFTDSHLVSIYYGTMRIGIDMSLVSDDDVSMAGDTLVVVLPPVTLLDSAFIDEARTRVFHESGRWTADDRERMYERARRQMLSHGMSRQNIENARDNADAQLRQMFRAMGFKNVRLVFSD